MLMNFYEIVANDKARNIFVFQAEDGIRGRNVTGFRRVLFRSSSEAVVLNLGTLTEDRAEAMVLAGKAANEKGVPVILDPIAVGETKFRADLIFKLLDTMKLTAICANAGEIAVLGGALEKTKSRDSMLEENDPNIAATVARKYETVVISTGKTDVITDGTRTTLCNNGHKMLQNITASGCLLTSLIG